MGSVQLSFSYLPHFSTLCASVTSVSLTDIPDAQLSLLMEKTSFLHCLFDGDTGRTSPNSLVSFHIRKHGGDIFSSAVRQYGFPFKWVQRLCGIEENVETLDSVSSERQVEICVETIGTVMKALRQRFIAQVYLTRQLVKLTSGILFVFVCLLVSLFVCSFHNGLHKIMKKAWSIRLGVFIEFCYLNFWLKTKQKALLTLNAIVQVTASYLQLQQLKRRKHLESTHQN